jgi:hypothetical protein
VNTHHTIVSEAGFQSLRRSIIRGWGRIVVSAPVMGGYAVTYTMPDAIDPDLTADDLELLGADAGMRF